MVTMSSSFQTIVLRHHIRFILTKICLSYFICESLVPMKAISDEDASSDGYYEHFLPIVQPPPPAKLHEFSEEVISFVAQAAHLALSFHFNPIHVSSLCCYCMNALSDSCDRFILLTCHAQKNDLPACTSRRNVCPSNNRPEAGWFLCTIFGVFSVCTCFLARLRFSVN